MHTCHYIYYRQNVCTIYSQRKHSTFQSTVYSEDILSRKQLIYGCSYILLPCTLDVNLCWLSKLYCACSIAVRSHNEHTQVQQDLVRCRFVSSMVFNCWYTQFLYCFSRLTFLEARDTMKTVLTFCTILSNGIPYIRDHSLWPIITEKEIQPTQQAHWNSRTFC